MATTTSSRTGSRTSAGRLVAVTALAATAGLMLTNAGPQAVAAPGPTNTLVKARNATAITYDPTSNAAFDSATPGWSYSAVALIAAGATAGATLRVSDIDYQWPDTTSGQPDAVALKGQTIAVNAPAGATEVGMIGASHGAAINAPLVFHYVSCDPRTKKLVKTTSAQVVQIPDWWQVSGPPAANAKVAPFLIAANAAPVPVPNAFYEMKAPLDPSKRLESITFPVANSVLFDLQVRHPSSPPKQASGCR